MTRLKTTQGLLCALTLLLCAPAATAESLYGVRVYSKSQTPRRVQNHRAYALKPGGDTWLFDRTNRKAMHKKFVSYCKTNLGGYVGKRIDCANLALDNLVNFAKDQGVRMTFKVYTRNGPRYVDTASFRNFDHLKSWTQRFLGAHNVTDNTKLVSSLNSLTSANKWSKRVKPGDLLMFAYYKPNSSNSALPGRMTTVGHTQPILKVRRGWNRSNTTLETINGDIQLSTGEQLPAYTHDKRVGDIHGIEGGKSLSNYPAYNGQLFKVLQHYNRRNPIGAGAAPQPSQGPVRWSIFM
jgi:hypothetical protein